MGVIRPGSYGRHDPRMDPESAKRLASGFWTHDYDIATCVTTWKCDKRKMSNAINMLLADRMEAHAFMQDPREYLDYKFGKDTGEAYSRRNRDDGVDAMAYWQGNSAASGSTTNTITTTSGSSGGWISFDDAGKYKKPKATTVNKMIDNVKLMHNVPFVCPKGTLLSTLQRDFDRLCGAQMKLVAA